MSKYVRIQSDINIQVTGGLESLDLTNKEEHISNKLRVQPLWAKEKIFIKSGYGYYPDYIIKWPAVIALQKDKIITIGEIVDELPKDLSEEETETTKSRAEKLKLGSQEKARQIKAQVKNKKKLSEIVVEDVEE